MGKHMPPPSFLIVQTNHLTTDRALGVDRIQASSARELEKFDNPYPKIAHDCLVDHHLSRNHRDRTDGDYPQSI